MGRLHTRHRILTMAIRFHYKLFNMQNERLPKIMFEEQLQQCKDKQTNDRRQNWLKDYNKILNKFGSSIEDIQSIFQIKRAIALTNFLKRVETNLVNQDLDKAANSNSYSYYKPPFISYIKPNYSVS